MSNSNHKKSETFNFNVPLPEPEVTITVFNGYNKEVAFAEGKDICIRLPQGLYIVRTDRQGQFEDTIVRHTKDSVYVAKAPPYFSPAPLAGAITSHEYYTGPSQEYSLAETTSPLGDQEPDAGLFCFIRANHAGTLSDIPFQGIFSIMNLKGQQLISLDESNTAFDRSSGWLAFSAQITSGLYIARYTFQNVNRSFSLYIPPNWQTQIFLTYADNLLPQSMRIFLSPLGMGFHADDRVARAVDIALTGLQNNSQSIPGDVMKTALQGKFDNPMLGLLGAHFLFRKKNPDPQILNTVIENLEDLIPSSPDLHVLKFMFARRFDKQINEKSIIFPPMLRVGTEAIIDESLDFSWLIPEDSLLQEVAPRLYSDSPWTMWETPIHRDFDDLFSSIILGFRSLDNSKDTFQFPELPPTWVLLAILDSLTEIIKREIPSEQVVDALRDLARDLKLPIAQILRTIDLIVTHPDSIFFWGGLFSEEKDKANKVLSFAKKIRGKNKTIMESYQYHTESKSKD